MSIFLGSVKFAICFEFHDRRNIYLMTISCIGILRLYYCFIYWEFANGKEILCCIFPENFYFYCQGINAIDSYHRLWKNAAVVAHQNVNLDTKLQKTIKLPILKSTGCKFKKIQQGISTKYWIYLYIFIKFLCLTHIWLKKLFSNKCKEDWLYKW